MKEVRSKEVYAYFCTKSNGLVCSTFHELELWYSIIVPQYIHFGPSPSVPC